MKYLSKGLSFLWKIWFLILNITTVIILIPFAVLFLYTNQNFLFYQVERLWATVVFYGCGLRIKKENFQENITPNSSYIIIANHTSMMDIMLMLILFPKNHIIFIGKKEIEKYPLLGYVYKKDHILVDRSDKESRKNVYKQVEKRIKEGKSIVIFPEGGVPKPEIQLQDFKDGAFNIFIEHQIPLVILTIGKMKDRLPYEWFKGGPGKVYIKYLKTIQPSNLTKNDVESIKNESYQLILQQIRQYETK